MRTINVGGRQGRGDPQLAHRDHAEGPGLLVSPFFWTAGVVCLALWAAFIAVVFA